VGSGKYGGMKRLIWGELGNGPGNLVESDWIDFFPCRRRVYSLVLIVTSEVVDLPGPSPAVVLCRVVLIL